MSVLVLVEGLNGEIKKSSLEAATYGSHVAKTLGTSATAIAIGDVNEQALAKLGDQGISKVLIDTDSRLNNFVAEAYVKVIAKAALQEGSKVIVFSNTNIGAAVGSRLAVRLNGALATNVTKLPQISGDNFVVTRGVFSGKAFADVNLMADVKIIAVRKTLSILYRKVATALPSRNSLRN
jgi:electron transfer flavoprotein alpha subunit